ncbi:MAG: ABC transporter ATP-binding protein [Granulosicoccus sp.]
MAAALDNNKESTHLALQATSLHKRLSANAAVSNISLNLQRGEVLGLLGLNGAGKTTTLRMLSGVLVPDSGTVSIDGFSLSGQPLHARSRLGYLPDQPPLYDDLRVHEYLILAGKIRGLGGKQLQKRQSTVIEQCMLGPVVGKHIGALSKGYKQRVGLAQALIHEPALLLLDEPSNGLDPQQLEGMRALITDVAATSAVILSTHLLSEAQAICNRVAIIHEGRLVTDQASSGEDLERIFQGAIQ